MVLILAFGLVEIPSVLAAGGVNGWGSDSFGQLNIPPGQSPAIAVSAGEDDSLVLYGNGQVVECGTDEFGGSTVPANLSNVVAVSAGFIHNLALLNNGTVVAWGHSTVGETNVPAGLSNVVAVAAGGYQDLALRSDGTVVAWAPTNLPPGLTNIVAISVGGFHALALRADGTVVGWGDDEAGQTDVPAGLTDVVGISAGRAHNLALKKNGTVVAWGDNSFGQTDVPAGLPNIVAIAAGWENSVVIKGDGGMIGWGEMDFGGSLLATSLRYVSQISSGWAHGLDIYNNGEPAIATQPLNQTIYSGHDAVINSEAVGAPTLSFFWQVNGSNIPGASSPVLTLANVHPADSGSYCVIVSNSLGTVTSSNAVLTISDSGPIIVAPPLPDAVSLGGKAAFSVNATGSWPLTYQWQFNGTNLPGATNACLMLTNVQAAILGAYQVIISNSFGTVTSSPVNLTIGGVVAWGDDSVGQTNVPAGLVGVTSMAGGGYHSLALDTNGMVSAWGDNINDNYQFTGQGTVPPALTNVIAVAGGTYHSLALKSDGTVVAWGDNHFSETNVPSGLSNVIAIAGSYDSSLALTAAGTLTAWGWGYYGVTTLPLALTNVVAIAGGEYHALALRRDGSVIAWGTDSSGQTNVPALSNAVAIAAGSSHSLALKNDGTVVAWGDNSFGETNVPSGLSNVVAIAAGAGVSVALKNDGTLAAWGNNAQGQVTNASSLVRVAAIASGLNHELALLNNGSPAITVQPISQSLFSGQTAYISSFAAGTPAPSCQWQCNGTNIPGATNTLLIISNAIPADSGDYHLVFSNASGISVSSDVALTVVDSRPIIISAPVGQSVFAGGSANFSVTVTGSLPMNYQWYFNGTNLPGATNSSLTVSNVQTASVGKYSVVIANAFGSVTTTPVGLVYLTLIGLGEDGDEYLNYAGETDPPGGLANFKAIAAGGWHALALGRDGSVTAWGDNLNGQATVPPGLSNVAAIAAGYEHSLALESNGTVVGWGANGQGQVSVPPNLRNVVGIAAGGYQFGTSLALKYDATVTGWGDNSSGETTIPIGLTNVAEVAAGGYHSLALLSDGTVTGWGDNSSGQATSPAGLSNIVAIAAGTGHSLALKSDGTVAAWGFNYHGQASVPSDATNVWGIAAGENFSLALKRDGTVEGWGENDFGELNFPAWLTNAVAASGGFEFSLFLLNDGSQIISNDGSPMVVRQQFSREIYSGQTVSLSIGAVGAPPMSYQWLFNSTNLPGATNFLLTLTNCQAAQTGAYAVVVSNAAGTTISSNAILSYIDLNNFNVVLDDTNLSWSNNGSQPWFGQFVTTHDGLAAAQSGAIGNSQQSTLQTTVTGPGTLTFWWKVSSETNHDFLSVSVNGVNQTQISGAVDWQLQTIYLGSGSQTLAWTYSKDSAGSSGADAAWLDQVSFLPGATPPLVLSTPTNQSQSAGSNAVFTVSAGGTPTLAYQWQFNSNDLPGATNATLTLVDVQMANAGTYTVLITNNYGATNASATLAVNSAAPKVVTQPLNQTLTPGASATFTVAVVGTEPFAYQWQFNGTNIAGATNATLALANIQYTNTGSYRALVSNSVSSTNSSSAFLTVASSMIVAWGDNSGGQTNVPPGLTNPIAVAAGSLFSMALNSDGTVIGWGNNQKGQTNIPAGLSNVVAIAAGAAHGVALKTDGTVTVWGDNSFGQTNIPAGLTNVSAISAGYYSTLAMRSNGTVAAWGTGATAVPANLSNVVAIADGAYNALAMKADGTMVEWGTGALPAGLTNITAIAAGGIYSSITHSLAVRSNGTVAAWDSSSFGLTTIPNTATNVVAVACGGDHNLVLRNDGTMVAWGAGTTVGTSPNRGQSIIPAGLTNAFAMSAGALHSLAIIDLGAPVIIKQPVAQTNFGGFPASFAASAVGAAPLTYQWLFNGSNVAGATNTTLNLAAIQPSDAGNYSLMVTNAFGTNFTTLANLSVLTNAPVLLAQPTNKSVLAGSNVTFTVSATGPVPIAYQWLSNSASLPGATNASLILSNVSASFSANYSVAVSNPYASTNSTNALLTVVDPNDLAFALNNSNLVWTTSNPFPWSTEITVSHDGIAAARSAPFSAFGQASTLQTTVTGPGTLSFWYDASTFALSFIDNGTYLAQFSAGGWQHYTYYTGGGTHTLQWQASPVFSRSDVAYVDQVSYVVGGTPPTITSAPPSPQSASAGSTTTFGLGVVGTPPLSFQWQFNSNNIPGATNGSFTLTDDQATNAGNYNVIVSNNYGVTNAALTFTVNTSPPIITAQPISRSMPLRSTTVFQVVAQGSEPMSYQWQFNSNNVPGATNAGLLLANLQATNAGYYQVSVSNAYGSTNSTVATLAFARTAVVAWGLNLGNVTNIPANLTNVAAITAGESTGLALNYDSSVTPWGYDANNLSNGALGLTNVVALACSEGAVHALALKNDGSLFFWGNNAEGQGNIPANLSNIVAIATGTPTAFAIESGGRLVGWGDNGVGETTIPASLTNVVAVAGGMQHTMALSADGTVTAWGGNTWGQTNVPAGLHDVVAISAGDRGSLALTSGGTVVAWGDNTWGETDVPAGLSNVVAISAGAIFNMALKNDGTLDAWGYGSYGETNVPAGLTNVVAIATCQDVGIALINDGSAYITRQPLNQVSFIGLNAVITAAATGLRPLNYQWQFNSNNIPGATNASLVLSNVGFTNQGLYRLVASNSFGSAVSSNSLLTVLRPTPQFDTSPASLQFGSNGFNMLLKGLSSDGQIVIYRSTNLINWVPIFTNPPVTGTLQFLDPAVTNVPAQFYRALEQ